MLSIVRSGPKLLIIATNHITQLNDFLKTNLETIEYDINTAFENSHENSVIILLAKEMKSIIKLNDIHHILLSECDIDTVLSSIINKKQSDFISSLRIAPRIIIMKSLGDMDQVINAVSTDYNAEVGTIEHILENHNEGTVISFTQKSLTKPIGLSSLNKKSLFIKKNFKILMKELKKHDLKYLNIGLGNKDWYELTIKIYDSYGQYALHYERLVHVIEHLELGLILGESWGTDAATIFYTVGIYRIRLVTFYEPEFIKQILLGLEYLDDGMRIVDLDLYHKRKKFYWSDLRTKEIKNKQLLSHKFRQKVLSDLKEDARDKLFELESIIISKNK
ncbi:hypothetical protein IZY60_10455 [Lutibacter sp. B2]|nr:hypothetical protein [Lutibacter sp. B2]